MLVRCLRAGLVSVISICFLQVLGWSNAKAGGAVTSSFSSPENAAQSALDALHNLKINDPNDEEFVKDLGFASAEEAMGAQLGSPIRIYGVALDELQKFLKGGDPNRVLIDTHSLIFPLLVKADRKVEVRSSVTVSERGNAWRVTRKGSPKLIGKIQQQNPSSSSFLITITPLRLYLLGVRKTSGELSLTAVTENPHFSLKAGDIRLGQEFFETIASAAKSAYAEDKKIRNGQKIPERAPKIFQEGSKTNQSQ